MTRRAAILGLGSRGLFWADACDTSGWVLRAFDPDPLARALPKGIRRESTISATVRGADWVICCLPERLELVQKVVQRAQAEAPREAIIAIDSDRFDIDTLQSCALRPAQVVRLTGNAADGVAFDVTDRNLPDLRRTLQADIAELAAVVSLMPPPAKGGAQEAESA
jgi:hypothetical protein